MCWGLGRPRRKEGEWGEGPSLTITAMFCLDVAYVFENSREKMAEMDFSDG